MQKQQKTKYNNSCWNFNDHIKENENILKVLAWQMKYNQRIYEQEQCCHLCDEKFLIYKHLI